jgi:hypothetical protein
VEPKSPTTEYRIPTTNYQLRTSQQPVANSDTSFCQKVPRFKRNIYLQTASPGPQEIPRTRVLLLSESKAIFPATHHSMEIQ